MTLVNPLTDAQHQAWSPHRDRPFTTPLASNALDSESLEPTSSVGFILAHLPSGTYVHADLVNECYPVPFPPRRYMKAVGSAPQLTRASGGISDAEVTAYKAGLLSKL